MHMEYKKPDQPQFFALSLLDSLLKDLKTSNVEGSDKISYSLLKNIEN
jgi:hypothetical protein